MLAGLTTGGVVLLLALAVGLVAAYGYWRAHKRGWW